MKAKQNTPRIAFSSDGIRGISGDWPFTSDGMSRIGQALSIFLREKSGSSPAQVVIGRDTRPSGQEYAKVLKRCLSIHDIDIVDLGITPTPVVAYITRATGAQLGIVISASHNPAHYNGIKLVDGMGLRLQATAEKRIEMLLANPQHLVPQIGKRPQLRAAHKKGSVRLYINDHIKMLGKDSLQGLRLVVDCSNGAVSRVADQFLTGLGAVVCLINNDLTGTKKINDECGSEFYRSYPEKLIKIVRQNKCEYGFAFDGDGDRIVVVDHRGNFYNGDDLLYTLASHYGQTGELHNNTIVITENNNTGLGKSLARLGLGIKVTKTPNGDKNLESEMWNKKNGFRLGGEQVGNIIINDGIHAAADSLYAISLILALLRLEKVTLGHKTRSFAKYPQVLASVHLLKEAPEAELARLQHEIEKDYNVRILPWYSTTEPGMFHVMIEGLLNQDINSISDLAVQFCKKVLQLTQEKPRILDLSSRNRFTTLKL